MFKKFLYTLLFSALVLGIVNPNFYVEAARTAATPFQKSAASTWITSGTSDALGTTANPIYSLTASGLTVTTLEVLGTSSGVTVSPAGSDTYVQFNNGGTTAGTAGLTFNSGSDTLSTTGVSAATVSASTSVSTPTVTASGANVSGTVTGGTLTDGTVTITGGNISGVGTITGATIVGTGTGTFVGVSATNGVFSTVLTLAGNAVATLANTLGDFAATTSAQLAGVLSDETGTGVSVFSDNPTLNSVTLNGNADAGGNDVNNAGTINASAFSGSTIVTTGSGVFANVVSTGSASTFVGVPSSTQTDNYTIALNDIGTLINMSSGAAMTLTVPNSGAVAFPTGTEIGILQGGTGAVTFATGASVTLNSNDNLLTTSGAYAGATLKYFGSDTWYLFGKLK